MIEIIEIEGMFVSMAGDYFESLIYTRKDGEKLKDDLFKRLNADEILFHKGMDLEIIEIKSQDFIDDSFKTELLKMKM